MNPRDRKKTGKRDGVSGKKAQPSADLQTPNANVGPGGECIIPPHPESVRPNTGEPCDDDRSGVRE